jgi:hypothetical protein
MRNLITFWTSCLTLVPGVAFTQVSYWECSVNAAERAYGRRQYREAESQFV